MTAEQLFALIQKWGNSLWMDNIDITYNSLILDEAISDFYWDYLRWYPNDNSISPTKVSLTPQLISILCYRIARLYHLRTTNDKTKDIVSLIGRSIGQIEIFYSSEIGRGLKINHGIGTVVGARVKIGDNCMLHQNITLGDKNGGRPTIGNNCIIYAGAKILGDIHIGDNSIIGANAVVLKSCPENSTLVGIPAKII